MLWSLKLINLLIITELIAGSVKLENAADMRIA